MESFDTNSSVQSTLKTDQIIINVVDIIYPTSTDLTVSTSQTSSDLPYFTSELELQHLTLGEPFEWELPDIEEGSYALSEIIVEPDAAI